MAKEMKTQPSASTHSKQVVARRRDVSRPHTISPVSVKHAVTPTSERIIRQISVKRRKAIKVLANR